MRPDSKESFLCRSPIRSGRRRRPCGQICTGLQNNVYRPASIRRNDHCIARNKRFVSVGDFNQNIIHYVNGLPVSEKELKIAPPFRIGPAELGNWNAKGFPENDPFMIRNFSGAIDDFCILGRALSEHEIRALYSQGKPQPEPIAQKLK